MVQNRLSFGGELLTEDNAIRLDVPHDGDDRYEFYVGVLGSSGGEVGTSVRFVYDGRQFQVIAVESMPVRIAADFSDWLPFPMKKRQLKGSSIHIGNRIFLGNIPIVMLKQTLFFSKIFRIKVCSNQFVSYPSLKLALKQMAKLTAIRLCLRHFSSIVDEIPT